MRRKLTLKPLKDSNREYCREAELLGGRRPRSPKESEIIKVLVTAGAGFIGSHIIDRLLEEGYEVTAVDNLSEGHLENVAHLKGGRGSVS